MANDTRGVFRLRSLRQENVEGKGVNVDDVWLPHSPTNLNNYGYWTSGTLTSGPSKTSITERTNFSTDTTETLPSSNHPLEDYVGQSLTSLTHFYTAGGWDSQTRVQKMSYSNETWSNNPESQNMVREQRESGTGVGPKTAGYIFMGDDPNYPGSQHSSVQKVVYSVDVWSQLPNFPYASKYALSAGNQTKAIIGGGTMPGYTSRAYKFTYATESYSEELSLPPNNSGPGNGERAETASTGNSEKFYVATGNMPSGINSTIFKYTLTTDVFQSIANRMSRSRRWAKAAGNSTAGYWAGGQSPAPIYTTMDKLDYSTDTATYTPGANLSQGRNRFYGTAPRMNGLGASTTPGISPYRWVDNWGGTYDGGWYVGGRETNYPGATLVYTSKVYKTSYAHDTTESAPSLVSVTAGFGGVVNNNTTGYLQGGVYNETPNGNDMDGIMKYDLITETASQLDPGSSRRLSQNNDMGIANSLAGYSGGGYDEEFNPNATNSITRKFTFSTESEILLPGAGFQSSPSPVKATGSVGNSTTHGYFGGGMTGAPSQPNEGKSDIVKFTYSTETIATLPANLRAASQYFATTSDATTGYFYGGDANPSGGRHNYIDKIVFSTDTRSNAGGNLANSTSYLNGSGNSSNGYVAGGWEGGSTVRSYVQKYNVSTETMSVVPSADLPRAKSYGGVFGPLAAGKSSIEPPEATPTPQTIYDSGGAGTSPNYGYTSGGSKSGGMADTIRLPFASDSRSTVPGAAPGRIKGYAISNGLANYMVGGQTPSSYPTGLANYWKYTYSTTTSEMTPYEIPNSGGPSRNKINNGGYASAGAYAGFISGGYYDPVSGTVSTTSKLDYSNESPSLVPGGNLPVRAIYVVGMGRANDQSVYMAAGDEDMPGGAGRMSYVVKISHVTGTASNALNLPSPSSHSCGTENPSNGYFGLGQMPNAGGGATTQMFKLTYSSETMARIPSGGSTGGATSGKMVMASPSHGYFTGGSQAASGSYTEKLAFSNDTMAAAPGAGLNYGVAQGVAFSPRENGIGTYAPQFNPVNV